MELKQRIKACQIFRSSSQARRPARQRGGKAYQDWELRGQQTMCLSFAWGQVIFRLNLSDLISFVR